MIAPGRGTGDVRRWPPALFADNRLGPAKLDAIRKEHVGSVWFTATTRIGVTGVRAVTDAVQAETTGAATGGVGFLVAANQEGGQIQALRGPASPRSSAR